MIDFHLFSHRLRPNVICSPSQGPCCTQDCKLKVGNKCRDDNGCRTASYCKYPFHTQLFDETNDVFFYFLNYFSLTAIWMFFLFFFFRFEISTGQGPQCPPSTNKANKTICNEEYVCYMGVWEFFCFAVYFHFFLSF